MLVFDGKNTLFGGQNEILRLVNSIVTVYEKNRPAKLLVQREKRLMGTIIAPYCDISVRRKNFTLRGYVKCVPGYAALKGK